MYFITVYFTYFHHIISTMKNPGFLIPVGRFILDPSAARRRCKEPVPSDNINGIHAKSLGFIPIGRAQRASVSREEFPLRDFFP
jgi:hypothetical protein